MRPRKGTDPITYTTNTVIRNLARRVKALNTEMASIDQTLNELITHTAPTLLELAGIPPPSAFEGQSLIPLVTGAVEEERESFAGLGLPLYPDASVQVAVTDGDWLYARNVQPDPRAVELLFDRRIDPGENVNLIELEHEQAARMRLRLDRYLQGERTPGAKATNVRIDPAIADRLRAMGYLRD